MSEPQTVAAGKCLDCGEPLFITHNLHPDADTDHLPHRQQARADADAQIARLRGALERIHTQHTRSAALYDEAEPPCICGPALSTTPAQDCELQQRKDLEWLVDKAIHHEEITVSRGAEILGIGILEMREIGRSLLSEGEAGNG